ncbi:MAG: hypothetical protein I3J02_09905 [Prevotella sp.]|nr:hypothetical protein [Prevotella sp.]
MRRIIILLFVSIFWLNADAQEYEITIFGNFQKYHLYPSDRGMFHNDRKVTAFSYDKKSSLAWVYCDEFLAQIQLPESFKDVMKEYDIKDLEKKKADVFSEKVVAIKRNLNRHYFVIDSIKAAREKYIADSIARVRFIEDSIRKRDEFVADSIEQVEEDTMAASYAYPFSFRFIIGRTKDYTQVGSGISDDNYSKFSGNKEYIHQRPIFIAGYYKKVIPKNYSFDTDKVREYYKAYALGREFYVDKEDVELKEEEQARLDSLILSDRLTRAHFINLTKDFSKEVFYSVELKNVGKVLDYYKKYPVSVYSWSWGSNNEYSNFQNVDIEFYNSSKKTIKYVYVTFRAKNAVGDLVSDATKTLTGIGPIEPGGFGSYSFEDVWYSHTIDKVSIVSIKVQYIDKTTKIINPAYPAVFSEDEKNTIDKFNSDIKALKELNDEE